MSLSVEAASEWTSADTVPFTDRPHCEADRRQEEFLPALAHALRNPHASIRSAVQIMRMSEGDRATASTACTMIERQVTHLVQFIDELLDVSRLAHGRLDLRRARVDLATVIQMAMEANRPLLESKQQHVKVEWPLQPMYVEADMTRLAQVFSNLLNNAAKYSDSHAVISVRAVREATRATVTIADSGIGIEPEMLARVFDRFAQTDRSQGMTTPHAEAAALSAAPAALQMRRQVGSYIGTATDEAQVLACHRYRKLSADTH
jgi:signal transduction histidine kinase